MGIFDKLKQTLKSSFGNEKLEESLSKTRRGFIDKVVDVFTGREIDDDFYDELEELLIQGDVGVNTSINLVENIRKRADKERIKTSDELKEIFASEIAELMGTEKTMLNLKENQLNIILVVGVNGAGKTTSIGKLTYKLKNEGKRVLLAAGDTFRAAAIDQLKIWGDRNGVDVVAHQEGADPGAVVYDGIQAALARKSDVLIVDTAGRLQNKVNLMEELKKIKRIIDREAEGSLSEVLLVLDATTGQNALTQAKLFKDTADVTGVILSKLDGTAKGGIVIGIKSELGLPVKLII
jgi:fused signal recognition particle receptor